MKRNDNDICPIKQMVLTCCARQNLCESHGEEYQNEWDTSVPAAAAEPVVALAQGAEEEGRDVLEGLMCHMSN